MNGFLLAALLGLCTAAVPRREVTDLPKAQAPAETVNVHAICHTHDDVGWLNTVDGYYEQAVRNIITTVVQGLKKDPTRKYTYVEIAFFSKWWDEQNEETHTLVKQLVNEGRLDFTIGGWCMPDEASPTYTDLIDQMALGHQWLKTTFGEAARPRCGWQVDPFGHSTGNTWLYKQFGFDFNLVMRIDHQDKDYRRSHKQMEFTWQPFRSDDTSIFTHIMYDWYCWPSGRSVSGGKVTWDYEQFANWIYGNAGVMNTKEIMAPMGCDFEWQNAEPDFEALDKLIAYFAAHPEKKINVFYSTPRQYSHAAQAYNVSLTTKKDDFWGYADYTDDYWSGYFTSHPVFKRAIRASSGYFHAIRALNALADQSADEAKQLLPLWKAIGVTQHHDAITGTSKAFVYDDYTKQLHTGVAGAQQAASSMLGAVAKGAWKACAPTEEGQCLCDGLATGAKVALFNPLAWQRSQAVTLKVAEPASCVQDATGAAVPSQRRQAEGATELAFFATLPPMGIATYKIVACAASEMRETKREAAANGAVVIENEHYAVTFTDDGRVQSVHDKKRNIDVALATDVKYYLPENSPENPRAGAYVMASNTEALAFPGKRSAATVYSGDVYQEVEVQVDRNSGVAQVFRLYKGERLLRMTTHAGPVYVGDNLGKEVIVRLDSDLASQGSIFTDTHGLEFVRHEFNVLSGQFKVENWVSGNFYPISLAGYIQDAKTTLGVVSDRGQAMASLYNGSVETLIHRRLTTDGDNKGVGEPLNDKTIVKTAQLVVLEENSKAVSAIRTAALLHEHPVVAFASTDASAAAIKWQPLKTALPANVHMTTLQVLDSGVTMLRLTHMYAVGEDAALSKPATVDIGSLFSGWAVVEAHEKDMTWNEEIAQLSSFKITLQPIQTRTFYLTMKQQ